MARGHARHREIELLADSKQRIRNEKVSFSKAQQHGLSQECFGRTQAAKASVRERKQKGKKKVFENVFKCVKTAFSVFCALAHLVEDFPKWVSFVQG